MQAVPQSKLRTNFRALLCMITKKTPNNIWKHFMTTRRCKGRILPLENKTHSRAWLAGQYTKHEQSCFLAPAQVQEQCRSSLALRWWPVSPMRTTMAFPGDHCPTHRWSLLVPVSLEQVPSRGKHPGLHIPPPLLNFFRNRLDSPQLLAKHPSPPADTPSLGQWGGQQRHPTIHEFSARKRIH